MESEAVGSSASESDATGGSSASESDATGGSSSSGSVTGGFSGSVPGCSGSVPGFSGFSCSSADGSRIMIGSVVSSDAVSSA